MFVTKKAAEHHMTKNFAIYTGHLLVTMGETWNAYRIFRSERYGDGRSI